jgi:hypothetical protein
MMRGFLLAATLAACWPAAAAGINAADLAEIRALIQRQAQCFPPRPSAVAFRGVVVMGEEVVQPVQITDRAGGAWIAYYAMQRQQDGSWKTHGCRLVQPRTYSA